MPQKKIKDDKEVRKSDNQGITKIITCDIGTINTPNFIPKNQNYFLQLACDYDIIVPFKNDNYELIIENTIECILNPNKDTVISYNVLHNALLKTDINTVIQKIIIAYGRYLIRKLLKTDTQSLTYKVLDLWSSWNKIIINMNILFEHIVCEINTININTYVGYYVFYDVVFKLLPDVLNDITNNIPVSQFSVLYDVITIYEALICTKNSSLSSLITHVFYWNHRDIEIKFIHDLMCSKIIVEKHTKFIHNCLLKVLYNFQEQSGISSNQKCKDENNKILRVVYNMMSISYYFGDRMLLFVYWNKYLESRMLEHRKILFSTELNLIEYMIKQCGPSEELSNMNKMINDIITSRKYTQIYHRCELKIKSDKFLSIKDNIDNKVMYPNILKYYAWNRLNTSTMTHVELPLELDALVLSFVKFYLSESVEPEMKIELLPEFGFAIIDYIGRNKITYHLYVNTLQLITLMQFNDRNFMTAKNISDKTKISIDVIESILDGLFRSKILLRNKKLQYKPNSEYHNEAVGNSTGSNVSLIEFYNIPNKKDDICQEVTEIVSNEQYKVLSANIVSILKKSKKLSQDKLRIKLQMNTRFEFDDTLFQKCITYLIDKEYIDKITIKMKSGVQNGYEYLVDGKKN
jgi:hypothetical protein